MKTGNAHRCPEPEVHAAFVAGTLSGAELMTMASHIRDCPDCRMIVAAVAHVDREERRIAPTEQSPAWPWWLGLAAAVLVGAVLLSLWHPWMQTGHDPISTLVAAAPPNSRLLEPRVSGGFRWAPLRVKRQKGAEPLDAAQMKLVGAAGEVLERTAGDPSPKSRHAAALAHLLAGRPSEAVTLLTSLSKTAPDALVFNDLAAARYAMAIQNEEPSYLAGALAAADAALRIRPDFAEAAFNRALIIDRLGLRSQAAAAWRHYLALDRNSEWANEAKRHLANLAPHADFRTELDREYARLTRDDAAAQALAVRFPQESRVWGESEILARWAQDIRSGDFSGAEAHLRVARAFGDALARLSGERLLQSAVRVAGNCTGSAREALADAHLRFRDAQRIYRENRPAEAEAAFTAAADGFERAGSPAASLARYFAANTIYDQGRISEARERLRALVATCPPEFLAHRAQLRWQLALADASLGQWGAAIRSLDESVALFERLREMMYATSVREILAEVYDRLGDPATAWHHRLIALQELGKAEGPRLQLAVGSIARAAALDRDWLAALAFLSLELEIARHNGNDVVTVETLLLRARVHDRVGETGGARADLIEAARMIAGLRDPALRTRAEAERLAVAGLLAPSPADRVALLTRAIDYHRIRGRRMFLPEMFLQRGRAFAAVGDVRAAERDFQAGIVEIEQQRLSLEKGETRWGILSRGDELYGEAVAQALLRGDPDEAFRYSERGRARELLESIERHRLNPQDAAHDDSILVEYSTLPTRLIVFVVANGEIRAFEERVARNVLSELIDRLSQSANAGDEPEFRVLAKTLYERLVTPVATALPPGRRLVFIPDAALNAVPFAALIAPDGRYLIEHHAVTIAPSAAVFRRLEPLQAHVRKANGQRLLVIAGPPAGDGELALLTSEQRESNEISAIYGPDAVLAAKDLDQATLADQAAPADVIHFVGHVAASPGRRDSAMVASRRAGDAGLLDVREIAGMNLSHVRVVVLAACNSARGEDLAGEGSISVARAFLAAGVPSVIATLWPIEDAAAADFFPSLHRRLAAGARPVDALRDVQLDCIRRRTVPFSMWAAVQVYGS